MHVVLDPLFLLRQRREARRDLFRQLAGLRASLDGLDRAAAELVAHESRQQFATASAAIEAATMQIELGLVWLTMATARLAVVVEVLDVGMIDPPPDETSR